MNCSIICVEMMNEFQSKERDKSRERLNRYERALAAGNKRANNGRAVQLCVWPRLALYTHERADVHLA